MPDVTESEVEILLNEERKAFAPVKTTLCAAWPDGSTMMVARHIVHADGRLELAEKYRRPNKAEEDEIKAGIERNSLKYVAGGPSQEEEEEPKKRRLLPYIAGAAGVVAGIAGLTYALWPSDQSDEDEDEDDDDDDDLDDDDDEEEDDEEEDDDD